MVAVKQLSWQAWHQHIKGPVWGATFPVPKEATTSVRTEYLLCICNVKNMITVDYNDLRFFCMNNTFSSGNFLLHVVIILIISSLAIFLLKFSQCVVLN